MTTAALKKFLVLYLVPPHVIDEWAQTDPDKRKSAEEQMRSDWQHWMGDHAKMIELTEAAGKTKEVTAAGITDTRNDIILYAVVRAQSQESVADAFAQHPHLRIPHASIQVMEVRAM